MQHDPFFGTLTQIVTGASPVNPPYSGTTEADFRVQQIWKAAQSVRKALFAAVELHDGSPADLLPQAEQTSLLMAAFCGRDRTIKPYLTPELAEALSGFRELVPLVPMMDFDRMTIMPPEAKPNELKSLIEKFNSGSIDVEALETGTRSLCAQAKLQYPADMSPIEAAISLVDPMITASVSGPALQEFASGSESRVFLSNANQTVYKALPFRGELIRVKPVLGPEPVEVEHDGGSFMADAHGGMPIFDRVRLLGLTPGVARTELVGITTGGLAIYKQPYLGDIEPSEAAINEWSEQFGHAALPEQKEVGAPAYHASNQRPFVTRSPSANKFVVGMDLNPANTRLWNGQCIPFDPVLRELEPSEIACHPQIAKAVEKTRTLMLKKEVSMEI